MRVHFIKGNNTIAFFPDSLRFFVINEKTEDILKAHINCEDTEAIIGKFGISSNDYMDFISKINKLAQTVQADNVKTPAARMDKKVLDKLAIIVSNSCNLKCKYCYANGGNYCSEEYLISTEMIDKILSSFYRYFDEINIIQIFGGEPMLNPMAIEHIAVSIENMYEAGKISKKPMIGMVSNGTLVDDRIIKIIKKYKMSVTVSLDGPPDANNAMRVFTDGTGTSDVVVNNIKRLKEAIGDSVSIEATYNRHHVKNGISVADTIRYVNETFGVTGIHITPVSGLEGSDFVLEDKGPFIESVANVFDSLNNKNPINYTLVQRFVNSLQKKSCSSHLCGAGISTISVSANGDIYPCFMFTDVDQYKLGNVSDENIFKSDALLKTTGEFKSFNKLESGKCKDCFINNICYGCVGINYFESGSPFETPESYCHMYKAMVEKILINLSNMHEQEAVA